MIGTAKQIDFAAKCIEAAAAKVGRIPEQAKALDVIRLVDAGDLVAAEDALQDAAGWAQLVIVEKDGAPVIDAGRVIDTLKRYL